jgi:hypothetical protein
MIQTASVSENCREKDTTSCKNLKRKSKNER